MDGSWPFSLALFYPEKGFLAEYYLGAFPSEGKVNACPSQGSSPFVGTWSPELKLSFLEANELFGVFDPAWDFLSLTPATGVSFGAFYETYHGGNSEECLSTPTDLWMP